MNNIQMNILMNIYIHYFCIAWQNGKKLPIAFRCNQLSGTSCVSMEKIELQLLNEQLQHFLRKFY